MKYYDFVFRSEVWICSFYVFAVYFSTPCKYKPTAKRSLKLFQLIHPEEKFHKTLPKRGIFVQGNYAYASKHRKWGGIWTQKTYPKHRLPQEAWLED